MAIEAQFWHRLKAGTPETLSIQFLSGGVAFDPGVTTIGIVDAYGSTVVATGTATSGAGTNPRTYALAGSLIPNPNILTVTFTSDNAGIQVYRVKVVGSHLFTLDEARAFENGVMADETDYPDLTLEQYRARIAEEFDSICCRAFCTTFGYTETDGRGRQYVFVPEMHLTAIRRVDMKNSWTGTWTTFTSDELADLEINDRGRIIRNTLGYFPKGCDNVRLWYEYGELDVPLTVRDIALIVLREFAVSSNLSSRSLQETGTFGVIQLAVPGRYGDWYGIPIVDEELDRLRERRPGFA